MFINIVIKTLIRKFGFEISKISKSNVENILSKDTQRLLQWSVFRI